jgi:hypothetical protein
MQSSTDHAYGHVAGEETGCLNISENVKSWKHAVLLALAAAARQRPLVAGSVRAELEAEL